MAAPIDISPTVNHSIAVWPGDTPFRYTPNLTHADGANIDLGEIQTTVHVGAHVDAPSHYLRGGNTIEACSLEPYVGIVQVIGVLVERGARITPADLTQELRAPRLLLKTGTFPDPTAFNEDFAALSVELVDHLAVNDVGLVGLDTPSVDLFADTVLEAHQALARHGMANLEGIVLDHVEPGLYTLVALPLKLEGADASPVRAVLLPDAGT